MTLITPEVPRASPLMTWCAVTPDARCEAWCDVAGTQTDCDLPFGHEHEHEATLDITVWGEDDVSTKTNFIAWWSNGGRAFVGSDKAVDTGNIT